MHTKVTSPFQVTIRNDLSPRSCPILPPELLSQVLSGLASPPSKRIDLVNESHVKAGHEAKKDQQIPHNDISTRRQTHRTLCLTNKTLREAALPLLYKSISIESEHSLHEFASSLSPSAYHHIDSISLKLSSTNSPPGDWDTVGPLTLFQDKCDAWRSEWAESGRKKGRSLALEKVLPTSVNLELLCRSFNISTLSFPLSHFSYLSDKHNLSGLPPSVSLHVTDSRYGLFDDSLFNQRFTLRDMLDRYLKPSLGYKRINELRFEVRGTVEVPWPEDLEIYDLRMRQKYMEPLIKILNLGLVDRVSFAGDEGSSAVHMFCGSSKVTIHPRLRLERCEGVCKHAASRNVGERLLERWFRVKDFSVNQETLSMIEEEYRLDNEEV